MKVLQESLIVIENDKGEVVAIGRRNHTLKFYRTPIMTVEGMVSMLEQLAKQGQASTVAGD